MDDVDHDDHHDQDDDDNDDDGDDEDEDKDLCSNLESRRPKTESRRLPRFLIHSDRVTLQLWKCPREGEEEAAGEAGVG